MRSQWGIASLQNAAAERDQCSTAARIR